jgi:Arc/MetJ family transcription regulator
MYTVKDCIYFYLLNGRSGKRYMQLQNKKKTVHAASKQKENGTCSFKIKIKRYMQLQNKNKTVHAASK